MNRGFLSFAAVAVIGVVSALLIGGGAVVYNAAKSEENNHKSSESKELKQEEPDQIQQTGFTDISTTTKADSEETQSDPIVDLSESSQTKKVEERTEIPVFDNQLPPTTPTEFTPTSPEPETLTESVSKENENSNPQIAENTSENQTETSDFEISCKPAEKNITVGDDVQVSLILEGKVQDYSIEWDNRFLVIGNDTKTGLFEIDEVGEKNIWVKVTRKTDNLSKNTTCAVSVKAVPEPEEQTDYASEVRLLDKAPDDYKMYVNEKILLHQSVFEVTDGSAWLTGRVEITNEEGLTITSSPLKFQSANDTQVQGQNTYYLYEVGRGNVQSGSFAFDSLGFYDVVITVEAVEEIGGNAVQVSGSPIHFTIEAIEKSEAD